MVETDGPTAKSCLLAHSTSPSPSNQSTYGSKQNEDMIRYTYRMWLADKPPWPTPGAGSSMADSRARDRPQHPRRHGCPDRIAVATRCPPAGGRRSGEQRRPAASCSCLPCVAILHAGTSSSAEQGPGLHARRQRRQEKWQEEHEQQRRPAAAGAQGHHRSFSLTEKKRPAGGRRWG